jgi:hypothetical protein
MTFSGPVSGGIMVQNGPVRARDNLVHLILGPKNTGQRYYLLVIKSHTFQDLFKKKKGTLRDEII